MSTLLFHDERAGFTSVHGMDTTVFHTKRVEKCFCLLYILPHFSKTNCPMDMYYAPP